MMCMLVFQQLEIDEDIDSATSSPSIRLYGATEVSKKQASVRVPHLDK
jgi:hypothetical protein